MTLVAIFVMIAVTAGLGTLVGRHLTYEGYWLNGRGTKRFMLVATIVSTQVGAGTTMGIAASTASNGSGYGVVAVISTVAGFLLIPLLISPLRRAAAESGEFTLTGLFRWRFGPRSGVATALVALGAYLALLAGQLVAGAALLELLTSLSWGESVVVSSVLVIAYAAFAGLRGDVITDAFLFCFQIALLVLCSYVLVVILRQDPQVFRLIPARIWSPITFGGYSYLIGGSTLGILVPLVSLEMWLRVFAAGGEREAKAAFNWSGIAVVPFYVMPMVLGLLAPLLVPHAVGGQTILVDILATGLPPTVMSLVSLGLVATIISTSNTLQIVVAAVLHRDLFRWSERSTRASRWISLCAGALATLLAFWVKDIVSLVLSGFFYIVLLGPLLIVAVRRPLKRAGSKADGRIAMAVAAGVVATTVGFPALGPAAVMIGFLIVCAGLVAAGRVQDSTPPNDTTSR